MEARTAQQTTAAELKDSLLLIWKRLIDNGDEKTAAKFAALIHKLGAGEKTAVFCGHFSAGKSSLINGLIGRDILPSSPIPTTANLARLTGGEEPAARVIYNDRREQTFTGQYNIDDVAKHALEGEVQSIELIDPSELLINGLTVIDTPGVDSTDDAHRRSTESAIHLGDLVVYVTDYNHVLSEMNLSFIKSLESQGKKIILVVNQIDKHRESEIPFAEYQANLEEAFSKAGLAPENIYFTSMKDPDTPHNQWHDLRAAVARVKLKPEHEWLGEITAAAAGLIAEHVEIYQNNMAFDEEGLGGGDGLAAEARRLQEKLTELKGQPQKLEEELMGQLDKSLKSAILMPFETRSAGEVYLESAQPDFKVGLLFSAKKTEAAREERLKDFHEKLVKQAQTLDWKIKQVLTETMESSQINNQEISSRIQNLDVTLDAALITGAVQEGATFNNNYILKFTEDVAQAVRQRYRQAALPLAEAMVRRAKENNQPQIVEAEKQLETLNDKLSQFETAKQQKAEIDELKSSLHSLLELPQGQKTEELETASQMFEADQALTAYTPRDNGEQPAVSDEEETETAAEKPELSLDHDSGETAEQLKQTAALIEQMPGFRLTAERMRRQAKGLDDKSFTVALFGAFSAGKSSFANALMGARVLPVSPNPTTAAINEIKAPTADCAHGTAVVTFKTREALVADINKALKPFGYEIGELSELKKVIKKARREVIENQSFVQAVAVGLPEMSEVLGTAQTKDMAAFHELVALESKACFVEKIDLYYDCALTRNGIRLVDTPGADSVNARHTNVAFDYIKNADAVFFVTYYNHAFSKADRDFLKQLGRVKDAFAMDKMFFVINAADLADSDTEMEIVQNYVKDQLAIEGIHNARIFPISSLEAMQAKESRNGLSENDSTGLKNFEEAFDTFINGELTSIAVRTAESELTEALRSLDRYIEDAESSKESREAKHIQLENSRQEIKELFEKDFSALRQRLSQYADKLLHYAEDRVFLRYNDAFKEYFNPAEVGASRGKYKEALKTCLSQLLEDLGFNLAEEMRATSLRVENEAKKIVQEQGRQWHEEAEKIESAAHLVMPELPSLDTPDFQAAFRDTRPEDFQKVLSGFKSPREFFENRGNLKMRDELKEELKAPVADYLKSEGGKLTAIYQQFLNERVDQVKNDFAEQTDEIIDGRLGALSANIDAGELKHIRDQVEKIIRV